MSTSAWSYFPLYPKVSIHLQEEPELELPLELEEEIEYLWQQEKARNSLYNERILCLDSYNEKHLFCRFVEQRYLTASRQNRHIHEKLKLYPLGVGGVAMCDNFVLVGRRDSKMRDLPGHLELVPIGSIETRAYQHGEVDFIAQTLWLLHEQAHIFESSVRALHPLGLFFSSESGSYHIGVSVNLDPQELEHELEGSSEYPLLKWYTIPEWENELRSLDADVTPLSKALWKSVRKS